MSSLGGKSETNRVQASTAKEFASLSGDESARQRYHWLIVPWVILQSTDVENCNSDLITIPKDVKDESASKPSLILSQNTILPRDVLEPGGIIISNPYPTRLKVPWFFDNNNLEPCSRVFMAWPESTRGCISSIKYFD